MQHARRTAGLAVAVVAVCATTLTACGGGGDDDTTTSSSRSSTTRPATSSTFDSTTASTLPSSTTAASTSTTTVATTTTQPPTDCVGPVAQWPLDQRLAQLLLVRADLDDLDRAADAAAAGVGGFVLFGSPTAGEVPALTAGLAQLTSTTVASGTVAPWMATDEEGGSVSRFGSALGRLPSARAMADEWSTNQVREAWSDHARAMRALGVSVDLAPVLDTAPVDSTVALENERSFSEDPEVASAYGRAVVDGLTAGGMVAVVKHFPGFGHATANTDVQPASTPPLADLRARDLQPFIAAIQAGAPAVMVTHASVPKLTDGAPASLAPATYALLRRELGFRGVAMTDSLAAGAISAAGYTQATAAVAAIIAGADLAMLGTKTWRAAIAALHDAVSSGRLDPATVDADVERVLRAKGVQVCSG